LIFEQADGEDELKKRQLMELAIINGTYRDSSIKSATGGVYCNNNCLAFVISDAKYFKMFLNLPCQISVFFSFVICVVM